MTCFNTIPAGPGYTIHLISDSRGTVEMHPVVGWSVNCNHDVYPVVPWGVIDADENLVLQSPTSSRLFYYMDGKFYDLMDDILIRRCEILAEIEAEEAEETAAGKKAGNVISINTGRA